MNHITESKLVIANRLTELQNLTNWLNAVGDSYGLTENQLFRFDLCANEAVTNIISYAFSDNRAHEIELRLFKKADCISLEIQDDGYAFNPLMKPEHVPATQLEEADIGNLGIHLFKQLMDEINYCRINAKNILLMSLNT